MLALSRNVQQGPLKDLSIALRHASLRSEVSTQRDIDNYRVIISYPLNIL
ncbi:OprD family outer membrane porin [Pseudomonas sp. LT1P18]